MGALESLLKINIWGLITDFYFLRNYPESKL